MSQLAPAKCPHSFCVFMPSALIMGATILFGLDEIEYLGTHPSGAVYAVIALILASSGLVLAEFFRRRTQSMIKRLARSEANSRALIELAPFSFFLVGDQGKILGVNQAASDLLGYSEQELLAMKVPDFLSTGDKVRYQYEREFVPQVGSYREEWRARRKDGEYIQVEVNARALGDGRRMAIVRDISEQKWTFARHAFMSELGKITAQQNKDTAETLYETAALCVSYLADWCIVELRDEGSGLSQRKIVCRVQNVVVHQPIEPLREPALKKPDEGLNNEKTVLYSELSDDDVTQLAGDEQTRIMISSQGFRSCIRIPLKFGDDYLGSLSLFVSGENFKERDRIFAHLLSSRIALTIKNIKNFQTAQRAVAARDAMLAMVSHDLRNPLSGINISLELLLMSLNCAEPGLKPDELAQKLRSMQGFASRGIRLIEDLLDVTSIEKQKLRIVRKTFKMTDLLKQAMESGQVLAKSKCLKIAADGLDNEFEICADFDRISQVLGNLVENAVRHTPANGSISISAAVQSEQVMFSVRDTGPGIDKDSVSKIFDRYWQIEKSSKYNLGLGLAIAKGIVDAHGGRIWVESEAGQGARFYFCIPRGLSPDTDENAAPNAGNGVAFAAATASVNNRPDTLDSAGS